MTRSKYSLLSDLEKDGNTQKCQVYDIEMGIENIQVHIPIQESEAFEDGVNQLDVVNSHTLYLLAKRLGGRTEDI